MEVCFSEHNDLCQCVSSGFPFLVELTQCWHSQGSMMDHYRWQLWSAPCGTFGVCVWGVDSNREPSNAYLRTTEGREDRFWGNYTEPSQRTTQPFGGVRRRDSLLPYLWARLKQVDICGQSQGWGSAPGTAVFVQIRNRQGKSVEGRHGEIHASYPQIHEGRQIHGGLRGWPELDARTWVRREQPSSRLGTGSCLARSGDFVANGNPWYQHGGAVWELRVHAVTTCEEFILISVVILVNVVIVTFLLRWIWAILFSFFFFFSLHFSYSSFCWFFLIDIDSF